MTVPIARPATPPLRRGDWEARLTAFLASARGRPHDYGRHDCLLFAAGAVDAQTGHDYARGFRGRYRSERGAARLLRRLGHRRPEQLIDALLPQIPIGFAQRGDIVLDGEGIPGICVGGEALFVGAGEDGAVPERGFAVLPRGEWRRAWAVGR